MKYRQRMQLVGITVALAALCCWSGTAGAYTQPASVVDSGGGVSSSTGYENLASIGQPIIGLSPGPVGSNHAGFIPVLGAYGLLYPIIGFDPATFTFTFYIGEPAPVGQGLNLTNSGGSILEWTVARTQAWLTLSPLSGTGPAPVTVGINSSAPDLLPGVYHDTITISASGAENSGVTIPVTLTVGQDYTLTVTFASPTTPAGGGTVAFNPAPPVGAATCTGNPCERSYHSGTLVTLTAYGDSNSIFNSWSGACSGGLCSVTMSADRAVTATFSYVPPAWIEGTTQYFSSLVDAYTYAKLNLLTNVVIRSRVYTFGENLTLTDPIINVTLRGGYAPNYVDRPGYTLLQGKLTVGKGSMVTDRLTVK